MSMKTEHEPDLTPPKPCGRTPGIFQPRANGLPPGVFRMGRKFYARMAATGHIGMFATIAEAFEAFKAAHAQHYGERSPFFTEGVAA